MKQFVVILLGGHRITIEAHECARSQEDRLFVFLVKEEPDDAERSVAFLPIASVLCICNSDHVSSDRPVEGLPLRQYRALKQREFPDNVSHQPWPEDVIPVLTTSNARRTHPASG